jgi:phage terminase small subunit
MSKLSPRQEKFAKAVATGLPLQKAAKKAGYKGDPSNAHKLAKNHQVLPRIEELREKAEEKLEMSRLKALEIAWNRFCEDHEDAKGYLDTILKAQGWNEPEKVEMTHDINPIASLINSIREKHNV